MGGLLSGKILVLLAVGLIVLGPEKLPELARTLGRLLSEFRRVSGDLRREVDSAFGEDVTAPFTEWRAAADSWRTTATSWVAGSGAAGPVAGSDGIAGGGGTTTGGADAGPARVLVPDEELGYPPGDPSLN